MAGTDAAAMGVQAEGERLTASRAGILVEVDQVMARKGPIQVNSRYSTSRKLAQDYQLESKVVGVGMSGHVHLATGADGRKYAVKTLRKKGLSSRRCRDLKSEVEVYLTLDHPHIARLEMVYEEEEEIHVVMEFMEGGELYDRLAARKQYTEVDAADTTRQMLLAVAYLHANQIAHRDLKLENFLYERKETSHVKLIDFGFAKFWERSTQMSQACGSVHYVAPEVLLKSYTEKADMWSLGVIVFMLLTGAPPFSGSDDEVLKKIRTGMPHYGSRFQRLSEPAKEFVQALLLRDPVQRLSAAAALEHPWLGCLQQEGSAEVAIDIEILQSLRNFAHASHFRRAVLSMMAWSLSTEDRMELRRLFLQMDTEKKGTITHKQLKLVLEENFHIGNAEAEALFSSLDTDNDNELAYSEFLAAALQGRVKVHEDIMRKTFARFDCDDGGIITADNLRTVLGDTFEGADVEELIKEADTTGDGTIDYDEFLAYFHRSDEEAEAAVEAEKPSAEMSRKSQHTEKLAVVIDRLMSAISLMEEETGSMSPVRKVLHRRASKARTMPALHMSIISESMERTDS